MFRYSNVLNCWFLVVCLVLGAVPVSGSMAMTATGREFDNGYHDTRWGMSTIQVKERVSESPDPYQPTSFSALAGHKLSSVKYRRETEKLVITTTYCFIDDHLYYIVIESTGSFGAFSGARDALETRFSREYGKSMKDGEDCLVWKDSKVTVTLRWNDYGGTIELKSEAFGQLYRKAEKESKDQQRREGVENSKDILDHN